MQSPVVCAATASEAPGRLWPGQVQLYTVDSAILVCLPFLSRLGPRFPALAGRFSALLEGFVPPRDELGKRFGRASLGIHRHANSCDAQRCHPPLARLRRAHRTCNACSRLDRCRAWCAPAREQATHALVWSPFWPRRFPPRASLRPFLDSFLYTPTEIRTRAYRLHYRIEPQELPERYARLVRTTCEQVTRKRLRRHGRRLVFEVVGSMTQNQRPPT